MFFFIVLSIATYCLLGAVHLLKQAAIKAKEITRSFKQFRYHNWKFYLVEVLQLLLYLIVSFVLCLLVFLLIWNVPYVMRV